MTRGQVYDDVEPDEALLFARVLDGHGGGRALDWDEAREWKPGAAGEVLWVHLVRNASGVADWLRALHIPQPTVDLLTSEQNRPRAFREDNSLVAVLRGINFNPGAQPEDMVAMSLWADDRRVVTLRRQRLQTPRDTLADIDAGRGPHDAGGLVVSLVAHLIARMNRSIVDMNDNIDRLESLEHEESADQLLARIATIRRNSLALKRHMSPQHEALELIGRGAPEWFEEHDRREIAETIARLSRYLDDIDISKESALVLQDDLRARSLARFERTNYRLTIVAAIFLPLGFVTGLLGINVGGMPGVDDGQAFWIVVAICVGIFLVQLMLFWRWKWL